MYTFSLSRPKGEGNLNVVFVNKHLLVESLGRLQGDEIKLIVNNWSVSVGEADEQA